jgi:hypothetical protein
MRLSKFFIKRLEFQPWEVEFLKEQLSCFKSIRIRVFSDAGLYRRMDICIVVDYFPYEYISWVMDYNLTSNRALRSNLMRYILPRENSIEEFKEELFSWLHRIETLNNDYKQGNFLRETNEFKKNNKTTS